ncbi:uncharacterized protein LOC100826197 isoform X1 [Brachypodium distachyon]|uniref:uncharacterized protein LOC100826197 isoform X1 n=1 Tax=Brachypodium distachyon TaxID=15368 RepID=UPI000D0DB53D|nr:uncharacterized protein LOC100826197 isoform X1 [Brachypodium distachyon]|eukprot:XP_024311758.1 uncharacterized protein LOC100826197 isoform X1 [Brachypodium distachyon]
MKGTCRLNNRCVVPHNVALLYQAHINVEWCNKTNLVKYLFKYINKGANRTKIKVQGMSTSDAPGSSCCGVDEVEEYINCRYLYSCEAVWRLFSFDVHVRFPSVQRLEIHLPGMNRVTYSEDYKLTDVVSRCNVRKSSLTEWFDMNSKHEACRDLTYCEFTRRYTWQKDKKRWKPRGGNAKLGRIRYVHPTTGELFYLRMLLMCVRGAQSFDDLRTYQRIKFSTFREACHARGLLGDDAEWSYVFDETVLWATPRQLRDLFVTILMFCDVGDASGLFKKYWVYMALDILYGVRRALRNQSYSMPHNLLRFRLLKELSVLFEKSGSSIFSYNLPDADGLDGGSFSNRLVAEETCYDRVALTRECESLYEMLNSDQLAVYDRIVDAVGERRLGAFFVSGHGGTGKMFLWRTIAARLRSEGKVLLRLLRPALLPCCCPVVGWLIQDSTFLLMSMILRFATLVVAPC